jgi:hypothetical protein
MTSSPSDARSEAPARRGVPRRTAWVLAGVAVAAAAVYVVANWRRWEFELWAGGADRADQEYAKKIQATSDPRLDEVLLETVKDERKATSVRRACATFLVERNHEREIRDLLRQGTPHEQRVALAALAPKAWFHKEYLASPEYPVRDVLVAWITDADAGGADRAYAISTVLPRVWPHATRAAPSTVPEPVLRAVASLLSARDEGRGASLAREAAGRAVVGYRWCPGAPALLQAARTEPDAVTAMELLKRTVELHDFEGDPCGSVLPDDAVFGLVGTALARPGDDAVNRGVRMAALFALERHPAWAAKKADAIRATVESSARPEERGAALPALVASGDPSVRRDAAAWFHDPAPTFRSQAAQIVSAGKAGLEPAEHLSLLVGYFLEEPTPGEVGFRDAALRLRNVAGSWIGFPDVAPGRPGAATGDMGPLLRDLVAGRPVGGKSRADIGAAWWNWLAGKNGIAEGESLKAAFAARDAFWAKARAGDVAGARAALDAAPAKDSPLWEYERGWLAAKSKSRPG